MNATYGKVVVQGHGLKLAWGKSRAADESLASASAAVPALPGMPGAVPLPPGEFNDRARNV